MGINNRSLARLYLDWVLCRQALPETPTLRSPPPPDCAGPGLARHRLRRPRSNPQRFRERRFTVSFRDGRQKRHPGRTKTTSGSLPPSSAPATLFCDPDEMMSGHPPGRLLGTALDAHVIRSLTEV